MTEGEPQPEEYSLEAEFQKIGWKAPKPRPYRYPNYASIESREIHIDLRDKVSRGKLNYKDLTATNNKIAELINAPLTSNEDGSLNYGLLYDAGYLMTALEEASGSSSDDTWMKLMTSEKVHQANDEFKAFMKRSRRVRVQDAMVEGNNLLWLTYANMVATLALGLGVFYDPNITRQTWELSIAFLQSWANIPLFAITSAVGGDKSTKYSRLKHRQRKTAGGKPLTPGEFLNTF